VAADGRVGRLRQNPLDGDAPIEPLQPALLCEKHLGHPAARDSPQDDVLAEPNAGTSRSRCREPAAANHGSRPVAHEYFGLVLKWWVALITRTVPDLERMTIDSVRAPSPKNRTPSSR
jgi:hypothetical protein